MEMIEGRYVSACYFLSGKEPMDIMGWLYRDAGGPWQFEYRFRYYADEKAYGSADKKSWYHGELVEKYLSEATVRLKVRDMMDLIASAKGFEVDEVDIRSSDQQKVVECLATRPWAHVKFETTGVLGASDRVGEG